ncbi:MAG TPA: acylase [Blastocatellia bacterium]|nr:acylase [Blastocatellia bacterium]
MRKSSTRSSFPRRSITSAQLLARITLSVLLAAFITAALPAGAHVRSAKSLETIARSVTIYRDAYGVPHIYGPTDASCVFGFLYAQAQDNFWQIEDSYIRALGRASEVYGESTLPDDLLNRALEIPKLSQAEYDKSSPQMKALCDAAADGLNYFLSRNPDVKPRLLNHFEPWHVLAFGRFAVYQLFIFDKSGIKVQELRTAAPERLEPATGSNMWAISPSKSATGRAMLFINPHQPFFGAGQWYEGHLHSDEGWDMTGASFFGSAAPTIGHNQFLGWSHTVNYPDIFDVYAEKFDDPANPLAYRYGETHRMATQWNETIKIKTSKGLESKTYKFRKTHHGPIVAVRQGQALALHLAHLEEGGMLEEWYAMSKAHSMAEFKSAMSRTAIPMFNTMYADRAGNIFYVYNGSIPRRSTKFDWTKPVDGSNPETDWKGYHSFDELPQLTNPKAGFLQNCNSSPFTTTIEGNPEKSSFPEYMVREPDNARARISRRILSSKDKFTFEEWARAAFDTTVIEAETQIPLLAQDVEKLKQTDAARASKLEPVIADLKAWNGISTVDSTAMTVFALWFERYNRTKGANLFDPLMKIRALEDVIAGLQRDFGTWRVAWGEVNRLQRGHTGGEEKFSDAKASLPVAGAPGWLGIVFNFYTRPEKDQKRRYGFAGTSFVSVVEFGPQVQARSLLVFGENADPGSPHYFDQARLYAKGQFKEAWYELAQIKSNAKLSYNPGFEQSGATASGAGGKAR